MTAVRRVVLETQPPRTIELAPRHIGLGGQATVYTDTDRRLAVKLFRRKKPDLERRLGAMLRVANEDDFLTQDDARHPVLAWPSALVRDPVSGALLGYAMRFVGDDGFFPLSTMFSTPQRTAQIPEMNWRFPLGIARNLSALFDTLHGRGQVLGDVSDANLIVSPGGAITFLDCDSMPLVDPVSGERFPCPVVTPEYAPPELHRDATLERSIGTDNFSLAVLVCRLLLMGDHPFLGTPRGTADDDEDVGIVRNVRDGRSYLVRPEEIDVPDGTIDPAVLPPQVLRLAVATFGAGHSRPELRSTAAEWVEAIAEARDSLVQCERGDMHKYAAHLPTCPWCARASSGFRELFPPAAREDVPVPGRALRMLAFAFFLIFAVAGIAALLVALLHN